MLLDAKQKLIAFGYEAEEKFSNLETKRKTFTSSKDFKWIYMICFDQEKFQILMEKKYLP